MSGKLNTDTYLGKLEFEQAQIQYDAIRFRLLNDYNSELCFPDFLGVDLTTYISDKLSSTDSFSWADFGSGNKLALRDANFKFPYGNFNTYSVDILGNNNLDSVISYLEKEKSTFASDDLNSVPNAKALEILFQDKYAPIHFATDIQTIKLPEKVDLITACYVASYLPNPIPFFENAISQLNPGGLLLFNARADPIYDLVFNNHISQYSGMEPIRKDGELYFKYEKK